LGPSYPFASGCCIPVCSRIEAEVKSNTSRSRGST
jgi:hypothetical protein